MIPAYLHLRLWQPKGLQNLWTQFDSVEMCKMCRIGQNTRCETTGCEWLKVVGTHCIGQKIGAEDVKYFYVSKEPAPTKKLAKVVKQSVKKIPKKVFKKIEVIKKQNENSIDFSKIKVAQQDNWLSKIKTI